MEVLDVAGVTNIIITDEKGIVLYGSDGNSIRAHLSDEQVSKAVSGYDLLLAKFSDGSFSSIAVAPVISKGVAIGAVYVHEEDHEQGALLLDMQGKLRNISIVVAAFSVAMVVFIVWSVMRRITSILKAIKSVR
jgi:fructose-1-phosphate kinase PfkB-like protein